MFDELVNKIRNFNNERDWEKFHCPKNLALALTIESSEILEHYRWLTDEESYHISGDKLNKIEEEIGDVMLLLSLLSDKYNLNPITAAQKKIKINEKNYPVDKVRGKRMKYTELFKPNKN